MLIFGHTGSTLGAALLVNTALRKGYTFETLLWPLYSFAFEKLDLTFWMQNIFYVLYIDPAVYVPEVLGIIILTWFGVIWVRARKLRFKEHR